MMRFKCFFLIIINILINICRSDDTVEVKLKQGVLSGTVEKTLYREQNYYAFRGIPFAEPPLGKLRFKPPVPHKGWEGTYKAHDNKPICYQYRARLKLGEDFTIFGSEDCLHISVFSPNLEGPLPVVVFEYNDHFRSGFNGTDMYSPDFFMEEQVIVVHITHRLGVFGYLTTNDDVIPPNAGLKDFILGLKWIQNNIQPFGGDPKRVTLMGTSSGAALVDILLHSEQAKGLFDAAILQSGTALEALYFEENPREKAFLLGKSLNITTTDSEALLIEMQKIDPNVLLTKDGEAVDNTLIEKKQMSIFPFAPTIEEKGIDAILTNLPENAPIVNDIPVLIGMNSREGLDIVSHFITEPRLVKDLGQEFLMLFPIRFSFSFDRKKSVFDDAIKEILNFYFEEGYFYYGNILEYAVYIGDMMQNYALNHEAKRLARNLKSSVFYYMFDFRGMLNENSEQLTRYARFSVQHWGATLGDEVCYLHVCKRIKKNYKLLSKLVTEQPETKVLRKMVRLWTNFAKYRNPTPNKEDDVLKDFQWKPMDKESDDSIYLHITKALRMELNPLGAREVFWDQFLEKYSKLVKKDEKSKIGNDKQEEKHEEL